MFIFKNNNLIYVVQWENYNKFVSVHISKRHVLILILRTRDIIMDGVDPNSKFSNQTID